MGVMAPVATSGPMNMHTFIRATAVVSVVVALIVLAPKSAGLLKRSSLLNQAGPSLHLTDISLPSKHFPAMASEVCPPET